MSGSVFARENSCDIIVILEMEASWMKAIAGITSNDEDHRDYRLELKKCL